MVGANRANRANRAAAGTTHAASAAPAPSPLCAARTNTRTASAQPGRHHHRGTAAAAGWSALERGARPPGRWARLRHLLQRPVGAAVSAAQALNAQEAAQGGAMCACLSPAWRRGMRPPCSRCGRGSAAPRARPHGKQGTSPNRAGTACCMAQSGVVRRWQTRVSVAA